jgi:DNA polymerase III delta subunit
MLYILHGEDLPSIRNFILKLQQDNNVGSKRELVIEDTTPAEIRELISSVDMFGNTSMVVLDVTKMGRMNVSAYIDALQDISKDVLFVVFAGKVLSKANAFIKNASNLQAKVMPFKQVVYSNVFKFVDYAFSGNRSGAYKELRKLLLANEAPFYIFSMLVYGLRNIAYQVHDSPAFDRLPPFVKSKVKLQASRFTKEQINQIYEDFYELDKGSKSGTVLPDLLTVRAVESVLSQ